MSRCDHHTSALERDPRSRYIRGIAHEHRAEGSLMTDEIGKLRRKIRELESDLVVAKESDPRRRERRR
jgi:hypothetical protein